MKTAIGLSKGINIITILIWLLDKVSFLFFFLMVIRNFITETSNANKVGLGIEFVFGLLLFAGYLILTCGPSVASVVALIIGTRTEKKQLTVHVINIVNAIMSFAIWGASLALLIFLIILARSFDSSLANNMTVVRSVLNYLWLSMPFMFYTISFFLNLLNAIVFGICYRMQKADANGMIQ